MRTTSATIAAAAIAAALGLAGCAAPEEPAAADSPTPAASRPSPTSTPSASASPSPTSSPSATAQQLDPDAVVDKVAATYWSSDTTKDDTPLDAARRAGEWLTPQLRGLIAEDLPGGAGAEWLDLVDHNGRYDVTATDASAAMPDLPNDTEETASRGRIVELRPVGANDWTGEPTTLVVQFDLTRLNGAWLVDKITADEPLTDPANAGDAD